MRFRFLVCLFVCLFVCMWIRADFGVDVCFRPAAMLVGVTRGSISHPQPSYRHEVVFYRVVYVTVVVVWCAESFGWYGFV